MLATIEHELGNPHTARAMFEEALAVSRANNDSSLVDCLSNFAALEAREGHFERFTELNDEAIALVRDLGDYASVLAFEAAQPWVLRLKGNPDEAHERILRSLPEHLRINEPVMLVAIAEEYAAVLADLGDHLAAARLLGAADAMRERLGTPRLPIAQADFAEQVAKTHAALTDHEWEDAYQAGRNTTVEDALTSAHASSTPR
jgi:tetratricopeptide (TPR) repeat protein